MNLKKLLRTVVIICFLARMGRVYRENQPRIIAITPQTSLLLLTGGSTVQEVKNQFSCTFAVNGSYFGRHENGTFFPAGERWLSTGTIAYQKLQNPDLNLRETIAFDQKHGTIELFIQDGAMIQTGSLIFNAGPRLLKGEKSNPDLALDISHRNQPFRRTVLAQKGNTSFLILFKKKINLTQTAAQLLDLGFENAVNLDGGPSTAISSSDQSFLDFNEKERLPLFFCVK